MEIKIYSLKYFKYEKGNVNGTLSALCHESVKSFLNFAYNTILRNGPHKGLSFLAYLVRVLSVNDGLVLPTERTKVLVNDAGTIVSS